MTPRDRGRAQALAAKITTYERNHGALPGLRVQGRLTPLVCQFVDSLRRVEFAHHIRDADHDPRREDPGSPLFDPLRAAVIKDRRGEKDEAWWLVFLATHFGKHSIDGWRLTRDIYGKLGQGGRWDWATTAAHPKGLESWLTINEATLRGADGVSRRFSNHRKYESLSAAAANGTAAILSSYVAWIAPPRTHHDMVRETHQQVGQNPAAVFDALYGSLDAVRRFGRLGRFDFLTMLGKLGIAPIDPGSTYLKDSTGPLRGARLLFGGSPTAGIPASLLEEKLRHFGEDVGLGSQVLEDGICNWQKSPDLYLRFRG
ncbi:hypothetical protein ACIKT0_04655 [Hansschlegelia beijingensis]|uniref:alpha-glutamyl/putrescinyl thymine pyrophosphorylase clade 3 protein n=1 Tax=Hansschlegelia beijingensis TaxID=1133344 RepID=UPI00387EF9A1